MLTLTFIAFQHQRSSFCILLLTEQRAAELSEVIYTNENHRDATCDSGIAVRALYDSAQS